MYRKHAIDKIPLFSKNVPLFKHTQRQVPQRLESRHDTKRHVLTSVNEC